MGNQAVKTRGCRRTQEEWEVLIPNHHEGYISWVNYQRNQDQIRENAKMKGPMTRGPAQAGKSLLAGLLRCGRCGRKLFVTYSGSDGSVPRYACRGAAINHGEDRCISFGGLAVDRAIEREILKVVEPAAVEATLTALSELQEQDDGRRRALELALTQARYEADRVQRQYDAVEPENRLVASELERRWNNALAEVERLQKELQRFSSLPQAISEDERHELLSLADDLPTIWDNPLTDMRVKKRLVRVLVREIVADVDEERALVHLVIHWAGGCHTRLQVRKNRSGEHRYSATQEVVDMVKGLAQVVPDRAITSILNRLGIKTGKGNTWTEARVRVFRSEHRIPPFSSQPAETRNWITMQEAASYLKISPMSVRRLIREGLIPAKQVAPCAPWMIERGSLESEQVVRAAEAIQRGRRSPLTDHPGQEKLDLEPM